MPSGSGRAFAQWIGDFYQENRLARGEMTINDEPVDLARIRVPLLNIAGERDHIVPPDMARPLNELVSSTDEEFFLLPAGHVGLLVGAGAQKGLWPKVSGWLATRSG